MLETQESNMLKKQVLESQWGVLWF